MAKQWNTPPAMSIDPKKKYKARMETEKGTIVGTFQYMAPEVLQGSEADLRRCGVDGGLGGRRKRGRDTGYNGSDGSEPQPPPGCCDPRHDS